MYRILDGIYSGILVCHRNSYTAYSEELLIHGFYRSPEIWSDVGNGRDVYKLRGIIVIMLYDNMHPREAMYSE